MDFQEVQHWHSALPANNNSKARLYLCKDNHDSTAEIYLFCLCATSLWCRSIRANEMGVFAGEHIQRSRIRSIRSINRLESPSANTEIDPDDLTTEWWIKTFQQKLKKKKKKSTLLFDFSCWLSARSSLSIWLQKVHLHFEPVLSHFLALAYIREWTRLFLHTLYERADKNPSRRDCEWLKTKNRKTTQKTAIYNK